MEFFENFNKASKNTLKHKTKSQLIELKIRLTKAIFGFFEIFEIGSNIQGNRKSLVDWIINKKVIIKSFLQPPCFSLYF